jgi:vacuolar-type H+-ATPase subunit F/Vma7
MAQQKGKIRIKNREDGSLVAVIADEDTVTGTLLAGVGQLDTSRRPNFLVVNSSKGIIFVVFVNRELNIPLSCFVPSTRYSY